MEIGTAVKHLLAELDRWGQTVDSGHWQGVPTGGKPDLVTKELLDASFCSPIPDTVEGLINAVKPNMPWAEAHFQERVGREPTNPGYEYQNWPWWRGQTQAFDHEDEKMVFSHTYQERFWPKYAWVNRDEDGWSRIKGSEGVSMRGIRYNYGDLDDVIALLNMEPQTRQAYLPIFFPEDTGAVHGGRIPCTLGYHFLLRQQALSCWYDIRSCDAVRHFRDDVYLACRLTQWIIEELRKTERDNDLPKVWFDVRPGNLYFSAHSFHVHMGDYHHLDRGVF